VHHRILRGRELAAEIDEARVWVKQAKGGSERLEGHAVPEEVKRRFARSSRRRK